MSRILALSVVGLCVAWMVMPSARADETEGDASAKDHFDERLTVQLAGPLAGESGALSSNLIVFDASKSGTNTGTVRWVAPTKEDQLLRRYDKDRDGKLSEEEQKTADEAVKIYEQKRRAHIENVMKKYDVDRNGTLSEQERAAMAQAVTRMIEELQSIETLIDEHKQTATEAAARKQTSKDPRQYDTVQRSIWSYKRWWPSSDSPYSNNHVWVNSFVSPGGNNTAIRVYGGTNGVRGFVQPGIVVKPKTQPDAKPVEGNPDSKTSASPRRGR